MSYTIGVDVGYNYTKAFSAKGTDIFLSTLEDGTNEVNNRAIKIEYKEREYTIGEKSGIFSTDLNKINDPTFRLCLFTAIARQMGDDEVVADINLVTGLPAEYFKAQKQELTESLEGITVDLVLKDKPKRFTINKVLVFPQSAGLFILHPEDFVNENNIVIDLGGMTLDIAFFQGYTLADSGTYEMGMLKLYDKIVQAIKAEYKVSYDTLAAERIIQTKKIIVDDRGIDVTKLVDEVIKKHIKKILMNVKNGFREYNTSKRTFIGGGAYMLREYLPGEVKKDDIYINAKAFHQIGVNKFER